MAQHPHNCFGRIDVSDKERRLLQLNGGPEYTPGGYPENGPCREQFHLPMQRDGRGGQWITLQFDSQKHADEWHNKVRENKGQPGGNALLYEWAKAIAGGNPYPWIRTVGDAEYHNFNARHAANGTLVEPGYASNNRKNAETERAWNAYSAGRGPMPRDTRYQETGFRYRSPNGVSYGPTPENPENVAERGRREQLSRGVMDRWRAAEMIRREMRLALYNEAKRDGTDSYWGRVLRKFDADFKVMADNKPDLNHESQTNEQFDQWHNEQVTYLASVEKSVAEWQRVLLSPVGSVDVRNEQEKLEVLRQYDRTQVLFANFAASYILADEMINTTSRPPSERKQHVLKAITDLNAFGSHLYKYYRGQDVPKEQMDAYVKGTRAYLESTGALKKNEKLKVLMVTADEKGIQQLLELRTEMIGRLAFEPVDMKKADIDLMNGYMVFMRTEREYLKRTGVENMRTEGIDATMDSSSKTLVDLLGDRTNTLAFDIDSNPQAVLVAAARELEYLQAYHPMEFADRMKYLGNRDEGTGLGLIQKALNIQHSPLKQKTQEALTNSGDENAVQRLVAIREEMRFLKRHAGMTSLKLDERLAVLNELEDSMVEKIFTGVVSKVNAKDPVGSVRALESLYRENNDLAKRANKVELFKKFTQAFLVAARGPIREGVNAAITAVDTLPKDADDATRVATIDTAINAIAAETKLLTDLGIDADRIALIQKKIPMIDTRVAVRQKQESELASGAKKEPDREDFRKVWEMLKGEEAAIRIAYARDPKTMQAKLGEVSARKEAFKKTIATAADSAVASLSEKTSTLDDANRAEALLRVTLHQLLKIDDKNEPFDVLARRIPDPDASTKMVTAYQTIGKVRVAAEQRAAEKLAAEQKAAAEKLAAEQRVVAEKLAAEQKLAAEKLAADKAVGTNAMKAVEDDAAAMERWRSKVSEMEPGGKKLDVVDAAQAEPDPARAEAIPAAPAAALAKAEKPSSVESVLTRELTIDDRAMVEALEKELYTMPPAVVLSFVDGPLARLRSANPNKWPYTYYNRIVATMAQKDTGFLVKYAEEFAGKWGVPHTISVVTVADQFLKQKPNDVVTLRDVGYALALDGNYARGVMYLMQAVDQGDLEAAKRLVSYQSSIGKGSLPALRHFLLLQKDLATKQRDGAMMEESDRKLQDVEKRIAKLPADQREFVPFDLSAAAGPFGIPENSQPVDPARAGGELPAPVNPPEKAPAPAPELPKLPDAPAPAAEVPTAPEANAEPVKPREEEEKNVAVSPQEEFKSRLPALARELGVSYISEYGEGEYEDKLAFLPRLKQAIEGLPLNEADKETLSTMSIVLEKKGEKAEMIYSSLYLPHTATVDEIQAKMKEALPIMRTRKVLVDGLAATAGGLREIEDYGSREYDEKLAALPRLKKAIEGLVLKDEDKGILRQMGIKWSTKDEEMSLIGATLYVPHTATVDAIQANIIRSISIVRAKLDLESRFDALETELGVKYVSEYGNGEYQEKMNALPRLKQAISELALNDAEKAVLAKISITLQNEGDKVEVINDSGLFMPHTLSVEEMKKAIKDLIASLQK